MCLLIPKCYLTSHQPFISFHQPLSIVPAVPLGGLAGKLVESGFAGKKKCIALLKFQTILQKNAPFSAGNFPGVCDCIYNGHCKISNSSIKPESGILLSQQRGQKQPQATSLHIEILAARCSRVLSKYDLINGLLGWLCYKSCC